MGKKGKTSRNAGAAAALTLLSACHAQRPNSSTTSVVASTAPVPSPAAAPVAPPFPAAAAAPASLWTVRPRFRFDAGPDVFQETHCIPGVSDVLPRSDGGAWIFGACGLRLQLAPDGTVADFTQEWQPLFLGYALSPVCCAGLPDFQSAVARDPDDVLVAAGTSCGMDPSSVTALPMERFSGGAWTATGGLFYLNPHEGGIDEMVWGGGTLYALARGLDDSEFRCSVGRYNAKRWAPLRTCVREKGTAERFVALSVDREGRPWMAGFRTKDERSSGFLAFYDGKGWTEESLPVEEPVALSIAPDGAVWVSGLDSVVRRTAPGEYVPLTLPSGFDVFSLQALSASEGWLGGRVSAAHVTATGFEHVPLKTDDDSRPIHVRGAGIYLWAHDGASVWDVSRTAPPVPLVHQKPRGVTERELLVLESHRVWNERACKALKSKISR